MKRFVSPPCFRRNDGHGKDKNWDMQRPSCISGVRDGRAASASAGLLAVDVVRFFRMELFRVEQ